jgi:hypothetical protein
MFKLPIQYVQHTCVKESVLKDVEMALIYEELMSPTQDAKDVVAMYSKYMTTNVAFLQESITWMAHVSAVKPFQNEFRNHWDVIQNNSDLKHEYQYFEHAFLEPVNRSPNMLFALSAYFVIAPIMCVATPIAMFFIPLALILRSNLQWSMYGKLLSIVFSNHALYRLWKMFSVADMNQRLYLLFTALMYCFQVYSNIYGFCTFKKNISYIRVVIDSLKEYLTRTLSVMQHCTEVPFATYADFQDSVVDHMMVLSTFNETVKDLSTTSYSACGKMRAIFYELYTNDVLKASIRYAFQFQGYVHTVHMLHSKIGTKLNVCTFANAPTKFVNAYYPFAHQVKNSYQVKNQIITGPNASGKTTMLKATMINILMSQQVGCGHYKRCTMAPYDTLCSYLNIPDTSGRDSLFQAEARRCKEIVTEAMEGKRMFCIFDELFSGTNPEEAVSSSVALLSHLNTIDTFTFMLTTHFYPMCELLKSKVCMNHMKCEDGVYKYKLKSGISYQKGGHHILKSFDFPNGVMDIA